MDDYNALEASLKSALVSTIRSANSLGSEDLPFHRSLDSAIGSKLDQQNARLVGLAQRLVGAATANTEIVRPSDLRDLETVEDNWKAVVDVVDSLLERADTALDEFTGAVKRLSPSIDQTLNSRPARLSKIDSPLKHQTIDKPQILFDHPPENNEKGPFKPLLQNKPHAFVPWENSPVTSGPDSRLSYPHPYQYEIEQYRYPSFVYTHSEPIMYTPFESTTATWVDTEVAVEEMLEELKEAKEIAIDLEHHDNRSYVGIVSLMQISTREKDWIVDTLKPWRRKLECLNEVFTNPNILKVLHGAHMDVVWLQRDLGLYLVGLFDTHHASRALGYPGGSLAFLLKKFINFDAQKQYQMADWRVRPLPRELMDYARSDTHFLLYIYDNMRNELIQRSDFSQHDHEGDKLWDVLKNSAEYALQRYEYPIYDSESGLGSKGWYGLLSRTPAQFNKEQFAVFRAVHKWRDDVAREQDDSTHYVMPNHQIFSIAKAVPQTRQVLFATATPASQTLRLRADELISVIMKAKETGRAGPEMMEVFNSVEPRTHHTSIPESTATSVQATEVPAKKSSGTPIVQDDRLMLPVRTSTSAFWGSAFESSVWGRKRALSTASNIALAIPLPPLSAEVFSTSNQSPLEATQTSIRERPPTPASASKEAEDDIFVLKDMGRKRKRIEQLDSMAAMSDEVALLDEHTEALQEKAARKAAKKAAKKAAQAALLANGHIDRDISREAEEPFDYTTAPSILNPPRETKENAKERKKREKQLNPYAKALDAPKGLPRVQREKTGRSMTYRP